MSKPSMALLTAWVLAFERDALRDESIRDGSLWRCLLLSSCVAFFLNVANFLVTLHTSAVTLQVLGARDPSPRRPRPHPDPSPRHDPHLDPSPNPQPKPLALNPNP